MWRRGPEGRATARWCQPRNPQGRGRPEAASPAATIDPAWTPRHVEYQPGAYAREFRIADGIEVEAIRASLKNGVLELRLPKSGRRRPRTIQVAAA